VFLKTQNVPIILIGFGKFLPHIFEHYCSQLFVMEWDNHSPVGHLTAERLATTMFWVALKHHLGDRVQLEEGLLMFMPLL
jgi:hypothetical protein